MNIRNRDFNFHVKDVSNEGEFEGYGSVFDEIDSYREVIVPGAFAETLADWKSRDALPPVLWQHSSRDPLGPHTAMAEDGVGLRLTGRLLINDVAKAREAHALLKSRTISGLSIGFSIPMDSEAWDSARSVLLIKKVKLWECSLVTFPANQAAQVDVVKSALAGGKLPSVREFESLLREVGFSKSEATAIASRGLKNLQRDAEERGTERGLADQLVTGVVDEIRGRESPAFELPATFTL